MSIYSAHIMSTRKFIKKCFNHESISGPVLEIGSGKDQFNRKLFLKKYKVVASNIYPQNAVDYICSVDCLPFEEGKFGCVICEHVLEHVSDPVKAIEEMKRILKPKGLLILVVPFFWPVHEKPFDLRRFTVEGLRFLLMNSFEHIKLEVFGRSDCPELIFVTARKPILKKEDNERPKVSVIMPTYNRAHMISRSINSILNQTFKDWELIVVSDGSTDKTREVVKNYKDPRIVFLEKKENSGSASARNFGLKNAQGEYIAYCDDDEELFPYHLQTLLDYLEAYSEKVWIRGCAVRFGFDHKKGYRHPGFLWSLMHRRSALKKVGYFEERLRMSQDLDFVMRLHHCYGGSLLESIVTKHIFHPGSITVMKEREHKRYEDHVYAKRIRQIPKIFKSRKIKEPLFISAIYNFDSCGFSKSVLSLAKIFYSNYPGVTSLYLLGYSYYRVGNLSKAIECTKKALSWMQRPYKKESRKNYKLYEFVYSFLGRLYSHKRKYNLSQRYFHRGLGIQPGSDLLKVELFHAYLEGGRKDSAQQIIKSIKNKKVLYYLKGVLFLYQGDYCETEKNLKKAFGINQSLRYRIYASLGKLYLEKGKGELAEKYFVNGLESERRTYFSFLRPSSRKVAHKDMREFLDKVFLPGRFANIRII